jgi:hypothetical protein
MRYTGLVSVVLTLAALAPASAADYPFVGKWDCEVATFTFTNRTYHNGSQTLRFKSIEFGAGNDVLLAFPDGYSVTLMNVTGRTMTWHSKASGDTFKCKRLPSR